MAYREALSPWLCHQCEHRNCSGECRDAGSCFCQGCVWFGSCLRATHQSQMQSSYPGFSSFFKPNWELPFSSLPMNEDSSSVRGPRFGLEPSPMLLPKCRDQQVASYSDNVDVSMDHSSPKVYETKKDGDLWEGINIKDIQSYLEGGDNKLDVQELFAGPDSILTDPLIDEIIRFSAVTATEATTSSSSLSQVSVNHQLLNSAVEESNAIEPAQWELLRLSQSNLSAETINANVPPLLSPGMLGNETLPLELNLEVGYDRRAREEAKKRYYAKREIRM